MQDASLKSWYMFAGTSKADKPYKFGNKSADVVLEVLNLDKKETVSIATISNQDLSEVTIVFDCITIIIRKTYIFVLITYYALSVFRTNAGV